MTYKVLIPNYKFEFPTTALRIAYSFDPNDIGADVYDFENGLVYKVLTSGVAGHAGMAPVANGIGMISLPLATAWLGSTGGPMIVFTSEDQATMGSQVTDSEAFTLRWNNHATPGTVGFSFTWPADVNPAVNATVYFHVSKSGATVGDATTLTTTFFNHPSGALHDADSNYGGATGALVGNATAKTVSTLSRTLALADLPAAFPCAASMTVKPTNSLLGTDDLIMHAAYILYRKK